MSRFGEVRGNARREPWGSAVEIGDGLFRIRLNNPVSALMVNTYAYKGPSELIVVDPGWPWTLEALEVALRDLGLARSFIDVSSWLYTHTHIDHMGAAGLLSEISDAPHYTWSAVEPLLDEWHKFQDDTTDCTAWGYDAFVGNDMGDKLLAQTNHRRAAQVEFLIEAHGEMSVHNFVPLEFGQQFRADDLNLTFLDARGHDPYHGAFFEPDQGWLFSGDVVIATPSPIVPPMGDDLGLYLTALDTLEALDATLLLPGHGVQRGGDLSLAFSRSRGYQTAYETQVIELLKTADGPQDLMTLGLASTPDQQPFELWGRWLVHLAAFDAHLQRHVAAGRVEKLDGPRYRLR